MKIEALNPLVKMAAGINWRAVHARPNSFCWKRQNQGTRGTNAQAAKSLSPGTPDLPQPMQNP
jgi:hypothetical protein